MTRQWHRQRNSSATGESMRISINNLMVCPGLRLEPCAWPRGPQVSLAAPGFDDWTYTTARVPSGLPGMVRAPDPDAPHCSPFPPVSR